MIVALRDEERRTNVIHLCIASTAIGKQTILGTTDSNNALPPSVTKICLIKLAEANEPIRSSPISNQHILTSK